MDELVAIKGNGAVFHPLRDLSKRNERCKKKQDTKHTYI